MENRERLLIVVGSVLLALAATFFLFASGKSTGVTVPLPTNPPGPATPASVATPGSGSQRTGAEKGPSTAAANPIEQLLADPHMLSGWLSLHHKNFRKENGKLVWLRNAMMHRLWPPPLRP